MFQALFLLVVSATVTAKDAIDEKIKKKHKGKKYCSIAHEKHFDSSNMTSSLNVCVEINNTKNVVEYLSCLPLSCHKIIFALNN